MIGYKTRSTLKSCLAYLRVSNWPWIVVQSDYWAFVRLLSLSFVLCAAILSDGKRMA